MSIIDFSEGEIPDEFSYCIKKGVESVFGMIFGDGPKYDGAEVEKYIGDGVVGIISFVGDLHWLLMVAFPRTSAENLISKFTGFEIKYDDPIWVTVWASWPICWEEIWFPAWQKWASRWRCLYPQSSEGMM